MMSAIHRKDRATAIQSGNAALAEMYGKGVIQGRPVVLTSQVVTKLAPAPTLTRTKAAAQ